MIAGIHHAAFIISDLAKARAFYEDVLGLSASPQRPQFGFDGVWYDVAPGQQIHLMLLPNPEAGLQRPPHGGRDRHVAFAVSDLSALKAQLESAGIAFTQSQSGRRAMFCRDPDQNALEFVEVNA
ncbi:MAG: VOC family protein [Sideroxyarcus sp.]|nr:VOC family protein [Sideroxyarcus sp.]